MYIFFVFLFDLVLVFVESVDDFIHILIDISGED